MRHNTFMKKENRNARHRELKAEGRNVRKSSIRNQLVHPMYVQDWPYEISQGDYQTPFSVLYLITEG